MNKHLLLALLIFINSICFSQDPTDIPGLSLWLRSDSGIVNSNDSVAYWMDISGNGDHAEQLTLSEQPTFIASLPQVNGHPSIFLDGIDDQLLINSDVLISSMFVLCNYEDNPLLPFAGIISQQSGPGSGIIFIASGNQTDLFSPGFFGSANYSINNITGKNLTPLSNIKLVSGVTTNQKNFPNLGIGRDRGFASRSWTGNIVEIIAFETTLTQDEQDNIWEYILERYNPTPDLGPDISTTGFCPEMIGVPDGFISYSWNTGDSLNTIAVESPGTYILNTISHFGIEDSDTINVSFPGNFIDDFSLCSETDSIWNTELNNTDFGFEWSDNSTESFLTISSPGDYHVKITDALGCVLNTDTITVTEDNFPNTATLGPDLDLCAGNALTLVSGQDEATDYLWMNSIAGSEFEVFSSGDFWVEVENELGCIAQDTISVTIVGEAPSANFEADNFCLQQITEFTDLSTPPNGETIDNWTWDFGDLNSSTMQEPTHVFDTVGTYTVSLQIETVAGCTDIYSIPLTINPSPETDFIVSNLCSEQDVFFNDNSLIESGQINNWSWEFGDSGLASGADVTHEYMGSGTYSVTLTTTSDQNCVNSFTQNITINTSPISSFSTNSTCLGQPTAFAQNVDTTGSGPIQNYLWDFGNGFTSSFPITSQTYFVPGEVEVTLTVTNAFGCSDDSIQTISINNFPEVGFENIVPCIGEETFFMDTTIIFLTDSIETWTWNFGNQGVSNDSDPVFIFENTGNIIVSLDVTSSAGCSSNAQTNLTVFEDPSPDFAFDPIIGLPPLVVTFENLTPDASNYLWTFGDGNSSMEIAPQYTYLDSGLFNIQLTAISENGCSDTLNKSIQLIEAIFELSLANLYCETIDGRLKAQAVVFNYGNHDLSEMDISLDIGNGARIIEHWTGLLRPNDSFLYSFVAQPEIDPLLNQSFFCSTLSNPNGNNRELSEENNTLCKALDISTMKLYPPFPNPNDGVLNFNYILPIDQTVLIEVFDSSGRAVLREDTEGTQGVNLKTIAIPGLEAGSYTLRIGYSNNDRSQNFIVK